MRARVILAVFGIGASAAASPSYPEAIQSALGMPCAPACTLCHDSQSGGLATANQPFALAMIQAGLAGKDASLVAPALEQLELAGGPDAGAPVDSDGDGEGDVAELREGRNPNGPGVVCGPRYGCGARVEPRGQLDGLTLAAALGLTALLFGLRRRRR
jgi:hypothetical protein